jgi:hypothetical protein
VLAVQGDTVVLGGVPHPDGAEVAHGGGAEEAVAREDDAELGRAARRSDQMGAAL